MKALIIAAGESERWQNFLGVPKHLVTLCGERLIDRTVRLLRENGVTDIRIVVRDTIDTRYKVPGARVVNASQDYLEYDVDKVRSSQHLWGEDGTLVLWGDVFFTDEAMKTICENRDEFQLFCRFTGSSITGKPWGEPFAMRIMPSVYDKMKSVLNDLAVQHKEGLIKRSGGWEIYREFQGANWKWPKDSGNATVIDDWTDDFDFPNDWELWCWNWAKADPVERPTSRAKG